MKHMPVTTEKYRADLAEYSYFTYEKFLHKVFMDNDFDVPKRKQIILYCFLNRGISTTQLSILYGDTKLKYKANYMAAKRLRDDGYLVWSNEFSQTKGKGGGSEIIYSITAAGVKYCNEIIPSLFSELMPGESFVYSYYTFSLDEVLDYLSKRCLSNSIKYIEHYLGTRDVNTYLLSHPFANIEFTYETEVGIAESGVPASLYTRSLMGFNAYAHPVRCDAMLTYQLPEVDDIAVRFFIELDTGTQRATVLTNKVLGYMDNYLNTESFSPKASLLFCLQTKADKSKKYLYKNKSSYGSKDYYYAMMLEFGYSMLAAAIPEGKDIITFGDAMADLKRLNDLDMLSTTAELVYKYFLDASDIDDSILLSELTNYCMKTRDNNTNKKLNVIMDLHMKAYIGRRKLLFRRAISLEGMMQYFLRGFSLYTAPNHCLGYVFPYLLPDMLDFRRSLRDMFVFLGLVETTSSLSYRLLYNLDKSGDNVLKNSYYFNKEKLHILVENITDDIGGKARISNLLNLPSIPNSLRNSKIICLLDDYSIDSVKELYLNSLLGKVLKDKAGSSCKPYEFEILFTTYNAIISHGSLFTFDSMGEVVYKYN